MIYLDAIANKIEKGLKGKYYGTYHMPASPKGDICISTDARICLIAPTEMFDKTYPTSPEHMNEVFGLMPKEYNKVSLVPADIQQTFNEALRVYHYGEIKCPNCSRGEVWDKMNIHSYECEACEGTGKQQSGSKYEIDPEKCLFGINGVYFSPNSIHLISKAAELLNADTIEVSLAKEGHIHLFHTGAATFLLAHAIPEIPNNIKIYALTGKELTKAATA